jgi:hypothetical protein
MPKSDALIVDVQVADAPHDEHDAEPLGEQPGFVGENPQRHQPQAKEDLRDQGPVVLGVEQEQHQGIRTRGAEGGGIGAVGSDPYGLMAVESATRISISLATLFCTCWSRT